MSSTSFQKKARAKVIQIPGAKPSLYNNQLLVSTGVPSLDNVIGERLNFRISSDNVLCILSMVYSNSH